MHVGIHAQAFITRKAAENARFLHENASDVTEEDLENEWNKLYQEFSEASVYCMECYGTDHKHYLGCSFWSHGYRKDS